MVTICCNTDSCAGRLADVWRLFVPDRTVRLGGDPVERGVEIRATMPEIPDHAALVVLLENGREIARAEDATRFLPIRNQEKEEKRAKIHKTKCALYRVLTEYFGRSMPWGALTGIRPVKLFREIANRYGEKVAAEEFLDKYLVSLDRTQLAREIAGVQRPYIGDVNHDMVVYAGIPFCPSRCRYCSFVDKEMRSPKQARARYVSALVQEAQACGEIADRYCISSLYVGGGTPTTLSAEELTEVLLALRAGFSGASEFTVEAGRPDTITTDKLDAMLRAGVNRICINPQTTNDETLRRIGRAHTAAQFRDAMCLAKGRFKSINVDTIAGLPGETIRDMRRTIENVLEFEPENVTVHVLAVKNAAAFADDRYGVLADQQVTEQMVEEAGGLLRAAGYRPYYLYRQKYMSGSLENVGYTRPGFECLYNIANMEETASVLALGAGAISKRITKDGQRIERTANVKNPMDYIERVRDMAERKIQLFANG